jgi:hypothetical protein
MIRVDVGDEGEGNENAGCSFAQTPGNEIKIG